MCWAVAAAIAEGGRGGIGVDDEGALDVYLDAAGPDDGVVDLVGRGRQPRLAGLLVHGSIAIGDPGIRGGRCHVGGIGARGLGAAARR